MSFIHAAGQAVSLLGIEELKRQDPHLMHEVYGKWPEMAGEAWNRWKPEPGLDAVDDVVFAGMGGSGSVCDVLASVLDESNVHATVVKGYRLPRTARRDTLVVCVSVSGETAETLSVAREAIARNCVTIGMSSGGSLEKLLKDAGTRHFGVPMVHSPRCSFASFLYSALRLLGGVIPLSDADVEVSLQELDAARNLSGPASLNGSNPALGLAEWIGGVPIILHPHGLRAAATRFKNSLQENAKSHVIVEDVLESCHNGIVSWEKRSDVRPVLLQGSDDHGKTVERWKALEWFFNDRKIDYRTVKTVKGGILSKLVGLVYTLDCSTLYRAAMSGVDPSHIGPIDEVKAKLRRAGG